MPLVLIEYAQAAIKNVAIQFHLSAKAKILWPQKVGAKAGLGNKLHTDLFTLGAHGALFAVEQQEALFGGAIQKLRRLQTQLLPDLG